MFRDTYRPGEIFRDACRDIAGRSMRGYHKEGPGPEYNPDWIVGRFWDNYGNGEIPEGIEQMGRDDYFDFEP